MSINPSRSGLALAALSAGPIFLGATTAAALYLELPGPLVVTAGDVGLFLLLCVPALFVGTLLAVIPLLLGTAFMSFLGSVAAPARSPEAWTAAGVLAGAGIALLFDAFADPPYAFGLILTSAACAAMCRR